MSVLWNKGACVHQPSPHAIDEFDASISKMRNTFTVIMGTPQVLERRLAAGQEISTEHLLAMLSRFREQAREAHGIASDLDQIHLQQKAVNPEYVRRAGDVS
jgi:hypothetical protein